MLSRQHIQKGLSQVALSAQNFGMTVTFVDNGGNTANREYMMKTAVATYADAAAAAAGMIPLLNALTTAVIAQYRVYQVFEESAFALPPSGVQVEDNASLTFLLAGLGNKKANVNIPAPVPGIFVGTSGPTANVVDINDAAITAFVDQFIGAGDFRISDGEAVARILSGKRIHKRSSRG